MKRFLAAMGVVLLAAAAFLVVDTAIAQGPGPLGSGPGFHGPGNGGPGDMGFGGRRFLRRLARTLDLTDEQLDQIEALLEEARVENEPLREQIRANHEAIREATRGGSFFANEAQVVELAQAQGALHAQMIVSHQRVKANIYQLLTPEQQQKWDDLAGMFEGGRRGGRRGRN